MKIAFDLDGTAWKYPDLFIEIAWGLKNRGHQVGILTRHNEKNDHAEDIFKWTMRGYPPPDFYHGQTKEDNAVPVRIWKAAMVAKYNIDYLFDDFASDTTVELLALKDPGKTNSIYGDPS